MARVARVGEFVGPAEGWLLFPNPGGPLVVAHSPLGFTYWRDAAVRRDLELLARHGCCVIAGGLGGATWGNDTYLGIVDNLVAWAGTQHGADTTRVSFIGDSMGACCSFNWAWRHPSQVGAVVGRVPAVNVDRLHDGNVGGNAAGIASAYGGAPAWETAKATRDPILNTAALGPLADRILVLWSTDDAIISPSLDITPFVDAVDCTQLPLGPVGHSPTTGLPVGYEAAFILDRIAV